jgi:methyl-accepting chemotaxis protein
LGYLNKSQFAFIYEICSTIHRIDKKDIISNLSLNAKSEIQKIQQRVDLYLNEKFFNRNFYSHEFKTDFKESQTNVAIFQRNVLTIEHVILPHCVKTIEQYNQIIYSKFKPILEKLKFLEDGSSTTYITNLAISHEYNNLKKDVIEFENSLKKIIKTVDKFSQFIENNSLDISNTLTSESSFLNNFHCPCCKKEMRISAKKLARVSCSHCNHNFIIDTGHEREITNNQDKNKTGILGWFKAIFKK